MTRKSGSAESNASQPAPGGNAAERLKQHLAARYGVDERLRAAFETQEPQSTEGEDDGDDEGPPPAP